MRGKRWFLAGSLEVLTWAESNVARDAYQPASQLFTAGLRDSGAPLDLSGLDDPDLPAAPPESGE